MTAQSTEGDGPLIPLPPLTEASLRVAVNHLSLPNGVQFEVEMRTAWETAIQTSSLAPMHAFLRKWGVWVAINRYPVRAARLHECERIFAESEDRAARRAATAEIGAMLRQAEREIKNYVDVADPQA
ncbi:hypothetical protein [Streptomyces sp. RKAG337]|uniref:hypothetical protein n=1 Tax=Streptomyces sp. RKAG337 TaxID=2893404 RepID=UPI0020349A7A|nr:hypothetical protein [Streptomyces sp. RKAG337]MCM2426573.1 hypothetical protein [Streptomyces sp. RKAG337]